MLRIERIEVFVTDLPGRLRRRMSSGRYDTGAGGSWIGKPVLVKLHAGGLVGLGQIRPISPGHWMPDTVYSMLHAITDYFGPRLIGMDAFDMAGIERMFDVTLPYNPNARAAIDHALHDLLGKAIDQPVYNLLGGLRQPDVPLEWSVSMQDTRPERDVNTTCLGLDLNALRACLGHTAATPFIARTRSGWTADGRDIYSDFSNTVDTGEDAAVAGRVSTH